MSDPFVRRAVVLGLVIIVLAALTEGGVLSYQGKNIPDFLISIGTGALGGLLGILVRMPDGAPE